MKIRNPELIGDIAVLFLTVGIFSWGFYNLGAKNGYHEYMERYEEKINANNSMLRIYLNRVGKSDHNIWKQLDEINKKIESFNQ